MATKKGFIHLYTGDGGGKTTSALGVAMRSVGQGHRVVVVQFMKGRKDIGEYKIQKKLGRAYSVYQFGTPKFVNLKKPTETDIEKANEALMLAKEVMREKKAPQLLILDEINLAAAIGLIDIPQAVRIIMSAPAGMDIYMTGRNAPKAFVNIADYATTVEDQKRPKKTITRKGIDY